RRHTRSDRDWSSDVCSSDLRAHFDLGRLQRRLGHLSDAEDHLARAVVLFADMGMRAWLETSQPELKALGHLVIVARTNVDLFDYLTDKFAGDPEIRVILDRRKPEPKRDGPTATAERRRHAVDQAVRTRALAVVILRQLLIPRPATSPNPSGRTSARSPSACHAHW